MELRQKFPHSDVTVHDVDETPASTPMDGMTSDITGCPLMRAPGWWRFLRLVVFLARVFFVAALVAGSLTTTSPETDRCNNMITLTSILP